MDQTTTPNLTLTKAESQVMRRILVPLLMHLRTSLTGIVSAASLWRQIRETIRLKCVTDGQWCQMGDYVVLMVKFGICDTSVTGMQLAWLMRMAHWGPLHMCIMQLIPRVTLLSTGFFDETESYTANLSRLWPATDWELHMRATSTGSMDDLPYAL